VETFLHNYKEHFYYVGAKESNRFAMLEALVLNFKPKQKRFEKKENFAIVVNSRIKVTAN
jgi:hypothetical protein